MFYPEITRRAEYARTKNGNYYSDYSHYRCEITEDCRRRCVYCDIDLDEMGGEGMQLDHFKPQDIDDVEPNDPTNLVLSCPKCNRLKSNHWPLEPDIAFFEPFTVNRVKNYVVESSGAISDNDCSRTKFKIKLLLLNRPARVQLRRSRFIKRRINDLMEIVENKFQELLLKIDSASREEISDDVTELRYIHAKLSILIQSLNHQV